MGTFRKAIFRNEQWEVTNCGIVSRMSAAPYRYQIDAERFLATDSFGDRQLYVWPVHVARMAWVNPDLFFEGFKVGIDTHQRQYVDHRLLEESIEEAVRNLGLNSPPRPYMPSLFLPRGVAEFSVYR
jgi:hypothetical protein